MMLKHFFCFLPLIFITTIHCIAQSTSTDSPPGKMVEIGSHKMHIYCTGANEAGITVILEAGGGGFSNTWTGVQELIPPTIQVCSYDRAGLGWSEPGPSPRTMRQEVFELHELLETINISGPFVLVGHSIGGVLVRLYAEQFDSEVAGMVLVDPTHESAVLFNLRENRWVRIRDLTKGRIVPTPQLEGNPSSEYNPDEDYLAEELHEIYMSRQARPEPLGERPLIVLSAGKRPVPPGTAEDLWYDLRIQNDGQRIDLTRLSGNSKFILAVDNGHNIPIENPQLVVEAINQVVQSVVKRNSLQ